ncbi:unnamed protein product [Haemonchus placei]|uniref:ShKT domain-containing protein n=1 Tax=Haemonchus placei TaxID=6290 RepID=A0A0N4VSR4_HAEPC|nr:unnamed protein product [Haemonchus placei]
MDDLNKELGGDDAIGRCDGQNNKAVAQARWHGISLSERMKSNRLAETYANASLTLDRRSKLKMSHQESFDLNEDIKTKSGVLATVLVLTPTIVVHAQLSECLNGGIGREFENIFIETVATACINGACVNSSYRCITTSVGQVCCEISQIRTVGQTAVTSSACVDRINPRTGRSDCPYVTGLCGDARYRQIMQQQCPRTCVCQDLVNTLTGMSDCGRMQQYCRNPYYQTLMSQQCPRTCGYCAVQG